MLLFPVVGGVGQVGRGASASREARGWLVARFLAPLGWAGAYVRWSARGRGWSGVVGRAVLAPLGRTPGQMPCRAPPSMGMVTPVR